MDDIGGDGRRDRGVCVALGTVGRDVNDIDD